MTEKVPKIRERFAQLRDEKILLYIAVGMLVLLLIFAIILLSQKAVGRTEAYKDTSGVAGLSVALDYDCREGCDRKYDFNVYFLNEDGRQVSVVRPDVEGMINLALAEGTYIMLVGKLFGDDEVFAQERLELRNGKTLEIKLDY